MDPQAALAQFHAHVADASTARSAQATEVEVEALWQAVEQIEYLIGWLSRGGYAPDWKAGR